MTLLRAPTATSMISLLRALRPASIMNTQRDYSNRKLYSSAPSATETVSIFLKKRGSCWLTWALDNEWHNHAKGHTIDRKPTTALSPTAPYLALDGQCKARDASIPTSDAADTWMGFAFQQCTVPRTMLAWETKIRQTVSSIRSKSDAHNTCKDFDFEDRMSIGTQAQASDVEVITTILVDA